MVVKTVSKKNADSFINQGGKSSLKHVEEKNILLRVPVEMLEALDEIKSAMIGKTSRNTLILQAIQEFITKPNKSN